MSPSVAATFRGAGSRCRQSVVAGARKAPRTSFKDTLRHATVTAEAIEGVQPPTFIAVTL